MFSYKIDRLIHTGQGRDSLSRHIDAMGLVLSFSIVCVIYYQDFKYMDRVSCTRGISRTEVRSLVEPG